ncbi:MAG: protein phosphatase 2C domain-containing protein [Chloroflexi bacterium]|nr:protein phosphatase 2C domain-containing protein [Chloroflexota bacterium]
MALAESEAPAVERQLELSTPFGHPVAWAEIGMVSDIGDSHELNDDRCLVITSRDLGQKANGPLGDFMLCLLADGATGSTFAAGGPAGWRASQLAQGAFVERFFSSAEVDVLDRLKDGLRAADEALVSSRDGQLSTTLTALYLASDGRAYAASIGDSVLAVLPPTRRTASDRRLKKLGYEDTTAVGSGDTTLSYVDEAELIEQWWPDKEGVDGKHVNMRVRPGTHFVLMSDGISNNLPIEAIDQLLRRHTLQAATVGLPRQTRERRAQMQRRGGGSTSELGLDNMSAIVVRFVGPRRARAVRPASLQDATLVTLQGTHGGPKPASGGQLALIGLLGNEHLDGLLPPFLRAMVESEQEQELSMLDRMRAASARAAPDGDTAERLAVKAVDERGRLHAFSAGWAELDALVDVGIVERRVAPAHDSLLQRVVYQPRLWGASLAALAVFLLVSTAFATGTVRPAPPPAATAEAGAPTPTPDTRPQLAIGGFQLVGPAVLPIATPTPSSGPISTNDAAPAPTLQSQPPQDEVPAEPPPATTGQSACANPLGLFCAAPTATPVRQPTPRAVVPEQRAPAPGPADSGTGVVPVPSPVPELDAAGVGPAPGSQLDRALQTASTANDQFNRSLSEPLPRATSAR